MGGKGSYYSAVWLGNLMEGFGIKAIASSTVFETTVSLIYLRISLYIAMHTPTFSYICAVAAGLIVPSFAAPTEGNQKRATNCRYIPGDPQWPSDDEWSQLNETIGGRLIKGVPLAQSCHNPNLNNAACANIQNKWVFTET